MTRGNQRCKDTSMVRRKHSPEVRFSIEPYAATPAQTEAGERLFHRLTARACASLTTARLAPDEGQEQSEERDVGGEERWPSS